MNTFVIEGRREYRLPTKGKRPRNRTRFSVKIGRVAIALLCVLAFVIARATVGLGDGTTIGLEYWLLGTVPLVVFWIASSGTVMGIHLFRALLTPTGFRYGVSTWVTSLVAYLLLHLNYLGHQIENPIFAAFDFAPFWPNVIRTMAYVGIALVISLPFFRRSIKVSEFVIVGFFNLFFFSALFWS